MPNNVHTLPDTKSHLKGLRLNDLVAKIAKVTLKDTTRVLLALDTVASFLNAPVDSVLANHFSIEKPSALESEKCTDAFTELREYLTEEGDPHWIEDIRRMD